MSITKFRSMLHNRLHREEIYAEPEYWDSKAESEEGKAVSMWPNNHLNECYHAEQVEAFDRVIGSISGVNMLEMGCGTGRLSRYCASNGATVTGIDFSPKAVEIAQSETEGDNPTYRIESVFDLSEEGVYDVVAAWGVLTAACRNRDQLANALQRACRALRSDGRLILMEPIHTGFLHRVLDMKLSEFLDVARGSGLEIQSVCNLHFWPARWALAFIPWPRWITRCGYRVGQWIMNAVFAGKAFGDYKLVLATRRVMSN